jgi:hypothetical protein
MKKVLKWGLLLALLCALLVVIGLVVWWFSVISGLGDALAPGPDDGQLSHYQRILVDTHRGELEHLAQDGTVTDAEVTDVVGDEWSGVTGRSLDISVEIPGAPEDPQCFRFHTDSVGGRVSVEVEPQGDSCTES